VTDVGTAHAYNVAQSTIREESLFMLDPKHLDDLAKRLSGSLPKGLLALQEDINRNLRASLEGGLAKLDLVTREEFDVQAAVLTRTREKLEKLEALVADLEKQLDVGEGEKKRPARRKTAKKPT
jgi:ubiquinone biosynthesis accessory factor UbiK